MYRRNAPSARGGFKAPMRTVPAVSAPPVVEAENEPSTSLPAVAKRVPAAPLTPAPIPKRTRVTPQVNHASHATPATSASTTSAQHFSALWRKRTNKKHKAWDGDGVLIVDGRSCRLKDQSGRDIARGRLATEMATTGQEIVMGSFEVEVGDPIDSGSNSLPETVETVPTAAVPTPTMGALPRARSVPSPAPVPAAPRPSSRATSPRRVATPSSDEDDDNNIYDDEVAQAPKPPRRMMMSRRNELMPLHNADAINALVLQRPPYLPADTPCMEVVVDPILASKLRPHQRDGVAFLYECVMGFHNEPTEEAEEGDPVSAAMRQGGAILGDEMGLGKTIQAITLVWTLLNQSPFGRSRALARALIVCPASLVDSWKAEFKKWLGDERCATYAVNATTNVAHFLQGKRCRVMIIGYERLRKVQDLLGECNFGIAILDEGHRIKNSKIQTAVAINNLDIRRRVILSGTPIQNDLSEFYSIVDFVQPGVVGIYAKFRKMYELPIVAGRRPTASKYERALASERSTELAGITGKFILRRTAEVNRAYLPPKTEVVVFCRPNESTTREYAHALERLKAATDSGDSQVLPWISGLRKLCVAGGLGAPISDEEKIEECAKMAFLRSFLQAAAPTGEKVVLVSNFVAVLDRLAVLCADLGLPSLRLDGSCAVETRHDLVRAFNDPLHPSRVFLLSARAGGVGLNLVGASRLVLCDNDWNPAIGEQSKARIWRDGQTRPVYIYTLLLAGTLEERIQQRQMSKLGLSSQVLDFSTMATTPNSEDDMMMAADEDNVAVSSDAWSAEDLAALFEHHPDAECQMHYELGCACGGSGNVVDKQGWRHWSTAQGWSGTRDQLLASAIQSLDRPTTAGFLFSDAEI
ncbi:SNF2 family N-terminal domain-containing protein [Blastocladiella britannica]|nr:SNF2 family N-terminal domain-containing protein [Blastocladiella britannica]